MIREKLIEDVVNSYNIFEEKLRNFLKDEKIDIMKTNRLLVALKENRKIIKRLFKDNLSLKVYKPETRKIIKKVRDNNDSYIDLLKILSERIFYALRMREMSIEDIDRLLEGVKHRYLSFTINEDFSETFYRHIISEELIQKIQDIGTPDLLKELFEQIVEELPEDYSEDWLNDFAEQHDFPNFPLRQIEAGAIIYCRNIPLKIISLFDEMRDCYMFGLYNATIIFCRAILEECLKQYYKNRNPEMPVEKIENMPLNLLLEKVNLPEELKKEAHKIRKEAKSILHRANVQKLPEIQERALFAIRSTTLVVEKLFI